MLGHGHFVAIFLRGRRLIFSISALASAPYLTATSDYSFF
jgi:hypothetical protein